MPTSKVITSCNIATSHHTKNFEIIFSGASIGNFSKGYLTVEHLVSALTYIL